MKSHPLKSVYRMPIMYQVLGIQWWATQTQSVPLWSVHPGWEWGWGRRGKEKYIVNKRAEKPR